MNSENSQKLHKLLDQIIDVYNREGAATKPLGEVSLMLTVHKGDVERDVDQRIIDISAYFMGKTDGGLVMDGTYATVVKNSGMQHDTTYEVAIEEVK